MIRESADKGDSSKKDVVSLESEDFDFLISKIRSTNFRGVFIAPMLNESEIEKIKETINRPIIFAKYEVKYPIDTGEMQIVIKSVYEGWWMRALRDKAGLVCLKNGNLYITFKNFVEYVVDTFGSFGVIIIMRKFAVGYKRDKISRKELIDKLESFSCSFKPAYAEIEAIGLLHNKQLGNKETLYEEVIPDSMKPKKMTNTIGDTNFSYDDNGIYFGSKKILKPNTEKYVVLQALLNNYKNNGTPINRKELTSMLRVKGHNVSESTTSRSIIPKIRDVLSSECGYGYRECIKYVKTASTPEKQGYIFEPIGNSS